MEFEEVIFFTWKEKSLLKLHIYSPRKNSPTLRRVDMLLRKSMGTVSFRYFGMDPIPGNGMGQPNEVQQHFARLGPATLGQSAFGR